MGIAAFAGGELSTREQCTTKELWKKSPSLAEPIDASEQNYCMAHAVGWIVEYQTGEKVSAFELGFQTHARMGKLNQVMAIQGLLLEDVLATANEAGFCMADRVANSLQSSSFPRNTVEALRDLNNPTVRAQVFPGATSTQQIRYSGDCGHDAQPCARWRDTLNLMNNACGQREKLNEQITFTHRKGHEFGRKLFSSLDDNKPAIVSFLNSSLFNQTDWPGAHATVLVGRKWNDQTQECDYYLRDVGGKNCKNFRGTVVEPNFRCENGNMIYGERRLIEITHETMVLKAQNPGAYYPKVHGDGITTTLKPAGVK